MEPSSRGKFSRVKTYWEGAGVAAAGGAEGSAGAFQAHKETPSPAARRRDSVRFIVEALLSGLQSIMHWEGLPGQNGDKW